VFTGSGASVDDVRTVHVPNAQRAWAQAGIEVVLRGQVREVAPPDQGLLTLDHTDDTGQKLTGEEQQLVGARQPAPQASAVNTDLNVYYVRTIGQPGGARGGGTVHGAAYPNFPVIALADAATNTALGHEIGHQLHQGHKDASGTDWPERVIMHPEDTGDQRDVPRVMVVSVVTREVAQVQQAAKGVIVHPPLMRYLVREP